jgi:hypothetical protein
VTRGQGRSRRWTAAARNGALRRRQGEPEAQSRGAEAQGGRRGKNEAEDYFAKPKKHRDFTEKSL